MTQRRELQFSMVVIVVLMTILSTLPSEQRLPVNAQDSTREAIVSTTGHPATDHLELQPITADNADQITPIKWLERGTITTLAWSPDGETFALASSAGLWLYPTNDLNAAPRLLEGHTAKVT